VEQGTDGSWLVIDRGTDGQQRRAISREEDKQAVLDTAHALSEMEKFTSGLPAPDGDWFDVDDLIADLSAKIDAQHNFDHLMRPER
jgi:hypothetical protein